MRSNASYAALIASMLGVASADFFIYHTNTIQADPQLSGGYGAIFHHKSELDCGDVGNSMDTGWVGDASNGGVRCNGCPFDADSIESWDIEELEWKDEELTTWNDGWVTLRKDEDDPERYLMHYVNSDRDEDGLITNSECFRESNTELACTGPALGNTIVKKIFGCYTSIESMQNPA